MTSVVVLASVGGDMVRVGDGVIAVISDCPVESVAVDAILSVIGGTATNTFLSQPVRIKNGSGGIHFDCPNPQKFGLPDEAVEIMIRVTEPNKTVAYDSITIDQTPLDEG